MSTAAILFSVAAVPRIVYLLIFRPSVESQYWALATGLLQTRTFSVDGSPVTDFEPIYPLFLAAARLLAGERVLVVQLLQIAVASAGAVLLYRLTLTLCGSHRPAVIAAVLYAIHPLLIRQAAAASDSALTTSLLIGFAAAFATIAGLTTAAIAGISLGLSVSSRAMIAPVVIAAVAILFVRRGGREAFVLAVCALVVMIPWSIRNYAINETWWPTRSGIALYIGNSPYTAALLPDYDLDLLEQPAYELAFRTRPDLKSDGPSSVAAIDGYLTHLSIEHMLARPLDTLTQKVKNVLYFFSPRIVPFHVAGPDTRVTLHPPDDVLIERPLRRPRMEIVAHAVSTSFVLLAAMAGIALRRKAVGQDAILWAIALVFASVYAIYFPATRYRAPMEFVLLFYAAVALASAMTASHTASNEVSLRG